MAEPHTIEDALRIWSQEMHRAAAVCEEAGAGVQIIDGNRACGSTLLQGADRIAALETAIREMLDAGPTEWGDVVRAAERVGIEEASDG
jgi:hypothetical protein